MFMRLTEPLWTIHAVLNAAAVDGVVVLVVQQQRRYYNHISTVGHRVPEITQLTVVTRDHCLRVAAVWVSWKEEDHTLTPRPHHFGSNDESSKRGHDGAESEEETFHYVTLTGAG